ncbi:DoxX family protein [Flagellimonas pacifica]|uniref:DoxX-like family protein n=1 Tax=Flagellimonas pacifica TaxID=1247520 RepID=A0A285MZ09_9FLAO|nr:DoxX family protein [Allomuricauda parva]SNZ01913.1 DoxX-like family protein [Allomuricauda parva]
MKKQYTTYYIFLGLFSLMILTSLYKHLFDYETMVQEYAKLGYPEHLIKPLAIAQFIGLCTIYYNKSKRLLEWAYAGFILNLVFAIIAHYVSKYGNGAPAVVCLALLFTTYFLGKKRNASKEKERVMVPA